MTQHTAVTTPSTPRTQYQFRSGILFAIAGTALFSLKSIFIKLAFREGVDATVLLTLRMLIAFPFYILILLYALKFQPAKAAQINKKGLLHIFILGFLGYYLASYLDFAGLAYVSAQLERLTLFTYPVMVAILSWVFFREKITMNIWLALVISYIGVGLMYANEYAGSHTVQANASLGTLLVASAALSFAFYVIFSKAHISRLGSLIFTSIAMSSSLVFILVQFALTHDMTDLMVSGKVWGLAFLLALFSTVIPSFFTSEAIHRIGATRTSITGSLGPVMTMVFAVYVLDEPFGWAQIAGLLLVLTGVSFLKR